MAAIIGHQTGAQRQFGLGLESRIKAGAHGQPALRGLIGAKTIDQLAANILGEVVRPGNGLGAAEFGDLHRQPLGLLGGLGGHGVVVHHAVEHPVATVARGVGEFERVVVVGGFWQGRQECRVGEGQLIERLVEIAFGGRGHAVGGIPEVDLVEIEFENALLAEGRLDAGGENGFLDLAAEGKFIADQHVLGDLLGDGGGADRPPPLPHLLQIGDRGAQDRHRIDTAMHPEILVLGRHEGLLDHVGDGAEGHEDAPFGGQFGDQFGVTGINPAHHLGLVVTQAVEVGQVGRETLIGEVAGDTAADDDQHRQPEEHADNAAAPAQQGRARAATRLAGAIRAGRRGRRATWRQRLARGEVAIHGVTLPSPAAGD